MLVDATLEQLRLRPGLLEVFEDPVAQVRITFDPPRLALQDLDRLHLHRVRVAQPADEFRLG